MHGSSRMRRACGREIAYMRGPQVKRKRLDLDRHQCRNQRHLLHLRTYRLRCPVDLERIRTAHRRHMEVLHSKHHHRVQRELHRIHTHKLVDKAKRLRLETHAWDIQIGVWEKVNLIRTCPCLTKARDLRCNSTHLRRKILYLFGTLKIQELSLETILKSCSFGNVKDRFRRGDKA